MRLPPADLARSRLPAGLEPVRGRAAWGFAAPETQGWVGEVLGRGGRLRDAAAAAPGSLPLVGRGPVHAMPSPSGDARWVVRPYRRGGAVAGPLLGDRHLRLGAPRPVAEARASAELLERRIPTPRVLAGAVYPAGAFYRADLVTEYIPASRDLATHLLSEEGSEARSLALREAGRLVRLLAEAGVDHPDMNARNVLLVGEPASHPLEGAPWRAFVLDLDRCRVRPRGRPVDPGAMLDRLERSVRKVLRGDGARATAPSDAELAALRARASG